MNKTVIVYTMKGCPHCTDFKDMLVKEDIDFVDRDIDEYEEEYDIFTQLTENDFVPALLIIEENGDKAIPHMYAPDRDYNELTEAVDIIKKHII
jgi:glutaredoxin